MTHSNLKVEVQGAHILVVLQAPASKQNIGNKTLRGSLQRSTGRTIQRNVAWAAANDAARQLGWNKSCDEKTGRTAVGST